MAVGKISLGILLRYLVALMLAFVVLIPLVMTVFGGLKSTGDLLSNPIGWPDRLHWENFDGILQSASFWLQLRNSLFVMLATRLARFFCRVCPPLFLPAHLFPGREIVFNFFTLGLLFPLAVAILPLVYFAAPVESDRQPLGHYFCRKLPLGCPARS